MSELDDSFAIARDLLARLEERHSAGELDPVETRKTLVMIVGALMQHGRPERTSDKPPRGLGYGQMGADGYTTPDDAMIVASLPWFKGMSAAIRAHYPRANEEEVRVHARRIREHQRKIENFIGTDHPWETSSNWLGDLPRE
jgi:hypothetical protein